MIPAEARTRIIRTFDTAGHVKYVQTPNCALTCPEPPVNHCANDQVDAPSVQEVDCEGQAECQQHGQVQHSRGGAQSPEVFGGDVAAAIPDWRRPTGVGSKDT